MPLPETPTPTPDEYSARCPNPQCRTELWARRAGEWTLRNRILKLVDGQLVALCDDCGTQVSVPWLTLSTTPQPVRPGLPSRVRLKVRVPPSGM